MSIFSTARQRQTAHRRPSTANMPLLWAIRERPGAQGHQSSVAALRKCGRVHRCTLDGRGRALLLRPTSVWPASPGSPRSRDCSYDGSHPVSESLGRAWGRCRNGGFSAQPGPRFMSAAALLKAKPATPDEPRQIDAAMRGKHLPLRHLSANPRRRFHKAGGKTRSPMSGIVRVTRRGFSPLRGPSAPGALVPRLLHHSQRHTVR